MHWPTEAKIFVKDNALDMTVRQLINALKDKYNITKSLDSVSAMCRRLEVVPLPARKGKWSPEEEQFLKDNHKSMTFKELSEALNRSDGSVRTKWDRLQCTMGQVTPWMATMLEWVKDKKSIYDMSIELHDSGHRVDVRTNGKGKFALFAN